MPTIIDCPSCGRKLRVPDDLSASQVKCPSCAGVFDPAGLWPSSGAGDEPLTVLADDGQPLRLFPGVPPPPAPLRPVLLSSTSDPRPPEPASRRRPRGNGCPVCGQRVRPGAAHCPNCGEELDDAAGEDRPWERPGAAPRRDSEPHRGPLIHTLGLVSLLLGMPALCGAMCLPLTVSGLLSLALGLTAWVMAFHDLKQMEDATMDTEGRMHTQNGKNYAIAGTVLGALGILFSGIVHVLPILAGAP